MKITLHNNIQNSSLQLKDKAYFSVINSNGFSQNHKEIGEITEIGSDFIVVNNPVNQTPVLANYFIMFSKNKLVNNNSLLGYYAEVKLTNNSTDKAELFALSSEVLESSK